MNKKDYDLIIKLNNLQVEARERFELKDLYIDHLQYQLSKRGYKVMSYEDYSEQEIKNIVYMLKTEHVAKLKQIEIIFLNMMQVTLNNDLKINNEDRDLLIGIYDRMQGDDQ